LASLSGNQGIVIGELLTLSGNPQAPSAYGTSEGANWFGPTDELGRHHDQGATVTHLFAARQVAREWMNRANY
jgi:hypothetical protein